MHLSQETSRKIRLRVAQLISDRSTWDAHWKEISENVVPWRGRSLTGKSSSDTNDGSKKNSLIMDSAATDAHNIMSAGFQSGLTSPARPWFRLGFDDPELTEAPSVRTWLDEVERIMRRVMSGSNFYNSLHQIYSEISAFGIGAMDITEDADKVIRTRAYTVGEYYVTTSTGLLVDTVCTQTFLTTDQIKLRFGEAKLTDSMSTALGSGKTEDLHLVTQIVEPNDNRLPELRQMMDRPYRSIIYLNANDKHDELLELKGFDEFPFIVPRWNIIGSDKYGSECPGMNTLPDVKMIHKMQMKSLVALDKVVDPPLIAPPGMENSIINTMPGGVSHVSDAQVGAQGLSTLYEVRPDIGAVENKILRVEQKIRRGYFNDLFLMLANLSDQPRTATEVVERKEEKLLMLGPVLDRLHNELLEPTVDRVFGICNRAELLPPPPQLIQGRFIEVEFISVLAQAQKTVKLQATNALVASVGQLSALYPNVVDKLDPDEIVEDLHAGLGAPPSVLRSDEEVVEIRGRRQQQEQAQQSADLIEQAANIAKTGSQAQVGDSNLTELALASESA